MRSIGSPLPTQSSRTGDPLPSLPAFDFQPLTRVVFGTGSLARLGELVRELGGVRVLLVTDRGLAAVGLTNTTHFLRSLTSATVTVEAVPLNGPAGTRGRERVLRRQEQ